eukprot:3028134-Pleurochrysis_carterae.AAC.1
MYGAYCLGLVLDQPGTTGKLIRVVYNQVRASTLTTIAILSKRVLNLPKEVILNAPRGAHLNPNLGRGTS